MLNERELAEYLLIIKKSTIKKVKPGAHYLEDIQQDVFIKLFNGGFFEKYSLKDELDRKIAVSYINRTVKTCHIDYLVKNGITKALSKEQQKATGKKYAEIATPEDIDEHHSLVSQTFIESDVVIAARQAYQIVKDCLTSTLLTVKEAAKSKFLQSAFWRNKHELPLKALAEHFGFAHSNPTQEFNRFAARVNNCTEPQGITIMDSDLQVELLAQIAGLNKSEYL